MAEAVEAAPSPAAEAEAPPSAAPPKRVGVQWGKLRARVRDVRKVLQMHKEVQNQPERPKSPALVSAQQAPEVNPLSRAGTQGKTGILREVFRETRLAWRLDRLGIEDQIVQNFQNAVKHGASCFEFLDFDYSNQEMAEPESLPSTQDRYVRCFVSAPYADMQTERRLLAQEVFPTLRQKCIQLGIHFMEVDFGWGVPEQKAERKANMMERIMELRQNVRTYIIGLLGERYGFTYMLDPSLSSGNIDPLMKSKKADVVGLVEIEMEEGALSDGMPHLGFYYFRDPKYLNEIQDKEKRDVLQSEGLLARERLSNLKTKLRSSSVAIVENYKDPEELAVHVIQDLSQQIADDFPGECDQKTLANIDKHVTYEYEQTTLDNFTGRESEMDLLDERVLGVQSYVLPTVVTGEAGVGKSAFLVAWSRRFEQRHAIDFFFKQYAALHSEGGCWAAIIKAILDGMKKAFGLRKDVPNETRVLPGALSLWCNNLGSLSARTIVMIDAIDRVHDILYEPKLEEKRFDEEEEEDDEEDEAESGEEERAANAKHDAKGGGSRIPLLEWLPKGLPANVRMVVSCPEGSTAFQQLKRRKWNILKLGPLQDVDRTHVVTRLLKARGVTIPEPLMDRLGERKRTLNPLFLVQILRTVKDPSDMKPSGPVASLILCRSIKELISSVLLRMENKPGLQERHGLVEEVMCSLALSRRGLSEAELLNILQIPRALFTIFYLESRPLFNIQFGLLSLANTALYDLVVDRYLQDQDTRLNVRLRIADYFRGRMLSHRTVEEVPWQLFQCHRWNEVSVYLMKPDPFLLLSSTSMGTFDLVVYWDYLGDPDWGNLSLVDKCEDCARMVTEVQLTPERQVDLYNRLADLLQRMSLYDSALGFIRRAKSMQEHLYGLSILDSFDYMTREARLQKDRGDFIAARGSYQRIVEQLTVHVDVDGDGNVSYEELKATEAGTVLLETEEEFMHLLWQGGFWKQLEDQCIQMLQRDEGRPTNELLLFDMIVHSYLERGKYDSAKEFCQRAVDAVDDHETIEYSHVLQRTVGLMMMLEQYQKVATLVESDLEERGIVVKRNMEIAAADIDVLGMYALALCRMGRTEDAVLILDSAVHKIHREDSDDSVESPKQLAEFSDEESSEAASQQPEKETLRSGVTITDIMLLGLAGLAHRECSLWQRAEEYYQRAISLSVLGFGAKDPSIAYLLGEIASLYEARRDQKRAVEMRQTAVAMLRDVLGGAGLQTYKAVLALASTHWKFGDYAKAEQLASQVVYGVENRFGSRHELLPRGLLLLSMALMSQGKLQPAQEILQRVQRLSGALWGGQHSDAIDAALAAAQAEELRGEFQRAEMGYLEVLQTRTAVWGPDHAGVQQALVAIALLYFRIDALPEVEELLWKALPTVQRCHGGDSLPVAGVLSLLALVHVQLGKTVNDHTCDAVALLLRALRIRVGVLGAASTTAVQHSVFTALLFVHIGELARAEPLLRQGYLALQASLQPSASTLPLRKLVYAHLRHCNTTAFPPENRPPIPPWSDEHDPELQSQNVGSGGQETSEVVASLLGIPPGGWVVAEDVIPSARELENPSPSDDEEEGRADDRVSPDADTSQDEVDERGGVRDISSDEAGKPVAMYERPSTGGHRPDRPRSAPGTRQRAPEQVSDGPPRPMSAAVWGRSGSARRRLEESIQPGRLQTLTPVRVEEIGGARTSDDDAEETRPAPPSRASRVSSSSGAGPAVSERPRSKRVALNVDAQDEAGNTALHHAVRDGDVGAVRSLVECGASATMQNCAGEAPLHLAASGGHLAILRVLVGSMGNASVDLPGPQDRTALYLAVEAGAVSVVQYLSSESGADPMAAAANGLTPLAVATAVAVGVSEADEAHSSLRIVRALEEAVNRTIPP